MRQRRCAQRCHASKASMTTAGGTVPGSESTTRKSWFQRLRRGERRHRRERLRAPLGGEDGADQPGDEVVAVVGGHVTDVRNLQPRQHLGGRGGVEGRVLLPPQVAEDEHGVDHRHRHDADLQEPERRHPRQQPPCGHDRAHDQREPGGPAERVIRPRERGRQQRHDRERQPRTGAVRRPAERKRASGRHQQQGDPRQEVRTGRVAPIATTLSTTDTGATSAQPRPPNRSRNAGTPAAGSATQSACAASSTNVSRSNHMRTAECQSRSPAKKVTGGPFRCRAAHV